MPQAFRFDLVSRRISTVETVETLLVLSSPPYPVELAPESVTMSASLAGGVMSTALYAMDVESIAMPAVMESGSLRPQLQTFSLPTENVAMAGQLGAGELRQILRSTEMANESVAMSAVMGLGDLSVKLVSYTAWPVESVALSAVMTSGSLV